MKKKITYLAVCLSMVLLSGASPLFAHAYSIRGYGETMAENKMATSTADSSTKPGSSATTTDDSSGRAARLENEKKNLKEVLTADVKARIAARCVAAQVIVKTKMTNNTSATTARNAIYDEIVADLQSIIATETARKVDVSDISAAVVELQNDITAFKTANTTYQQALTDLGVMDCQSDPTAFKAALEAARTDQLAVLKSAKDIRTLITDNIKPVLQALKNSDAKAAK